LASSSYQLFVTFSGEGNEAIDTVLAIDVDPANWSGTPNGSPVTTPIEEPRCMALDANANLYVAQAHGSHAAILVFGPVTGPWPLQGDPIVSIPPGSGGLASPALNHPYGLAFDGANLFQSSQDTNVVSGYTISTTDGNITASAMPTASALAGIPNGTFYPGQYVMTSVPLATNTGITLIPQTSGGLGYTDDGKAHSVRGIAVAASTLYVADEAASLVGMYDTGSGRFKGWITTLGTKLTPMLAPVALATDASGNIYIGAAKTPAIYKWTPSAGDGALSVVVDGSKQKSSPLAQISGIAVLPDGSLLFGSRTAVASSSGHASQKPQFAIYRYDGTNINVWASGYKDYPEGLLLVTTPA
jgi:hypothetical protein